MTNPNQPIRRRTIDEWYAPPGSPPDVDGLGEAEQLDQLGDPNDDDDDHDHEGDDEP